MHVKLNYNMGPDDCKKVADKKKIEKSAATESICKLHPVTIYWHMI